MVHEAGDHRTGRVGVPRAHGVDVLHNRGVVLVDGDGCGPRIAGAGDRGVGAVGGEVELQRGAVRGV